MENLLQAYLINTAASSFDIITTALLHQKTGNPNELNQNIREVMDKEGPLKGAVKSEGMRRLGFAALGLALFTGEKLYTFFTNNEAFPISSALLIAPAFIYGFSGLLNLIPLSFNTRKRNIF